MDNLVERLQECLIIDVFGDLAPNPITQKAAAEIQKLRADLTQCTAAYNAGVLEIERLRGAVGIRESETEQATKVLHATRSRLSDAISRCERAEADAARMRAALEFRPTHRHVKRGTEYQVFGTASLQTAVNAYDGEVLVLYKAPGGNIWARPHDEFYDGRFTALSTPRAEDVT